MPLTCQQCCTTHLRSCPECGVSLCPACDGDLCLRCDARRWNERIADEADDTDYGDDDE